MTDKHAAYIGAILSISKSLSWERAANNGTFPAVEALKRIRRDEELIGKYLDILDETPLPSLDTEKTSVYCDKLVEALQSLEQVFLSDRFQEELVR